MMIFDDLGVGAGGLDGGGMVGTGGSDGRVWCQQEGDSREPDGCRSSEYQEGLMEGEGGDDSCRRARWQLLGVLGAARARLGWEH